MDTGPLSLFQTGVWLIPIILLVIIGGILLLANYWKRKTQQDLKEIRGELRRLHTQRRQLAVQTAIFSTDDPEPYGSRMVELQAHLEKIDQDLTSLETENVGLQERTRHLAATRWQAMIGGPIFWYFIRQDIAGLKKKRQTVGKTLEAAGRIEQAFDRLGWEVAMQAREIQALQQRVGQKLDQLRAKNLHGEAMDAATRQENERREALAQIPHVFFTGNETSVFEQADKDSVIQVHQVLADTRPVLGDLYTSAQAWEKQYAAAAERVGGMREALSRLEQFLDSMPAGIILAPLKTQFEQLNVISQNLHATLSRMEIESMEPVAQEAARVKGAAQEMDSQLRQARQQWTALEQVQAELAEGLKQLSGQFASLGTSDSYPISWEESRHKLTLLSKQANLVGAGKKHRTLEQVCEDLETATRLNAEQKELASHCQKIAEQHGGLLSLLSGPELSQGKEWLQSAQKLSGEVEEYEPENWPRSDAVANLPGELSAFAEGLRILASGNPADSIPETEIAQRLTDTRELVQFAQKLRTRAENIQSRLTEIQHIEEQALTQLESARTNLNQIALLVRSNPFLAEIAGQEVNRLQSSLQKLSDELSEPDQGTVDKKAKTVSAQVARVEQVASGWLDRLDRDLEAEIRGLSESITTLEAVASLDEPAVSEAKRLLSTSQSFRTGGPASKSLLRMDQMVLELKRKSDFWQSVVAASRRVEDIEGHITETYTSANQNRQFARQQIAELGSWLGDKHAWPPTSLTMDTERQELAKLEEEWEATRQQHTKAISLVSHLGSLSARYHALAEKVRQISERAEQEQVQVEKLENELGELLQLWQNQWHSHRDNPIATEEIQRLLEDVDREQNQLQQQYRQGSKGYQQVLQTLQSLHRRARLAQISIDDNHVIDVNGRMIAYR